MDFNRCAKIVQTERSTKAENNVFRLFTSEFILHAGLKVSYVLSSKKILISVIFLGGLSL